MKPFEMTVASRAILSAIVLLGAAPGASAEDCVGDAMIVSMAAKGLRAGIERYDEVGRIMLAERTMTRQPVSNDRLEVIKRLVEYAAAHEGQGKGSTQALRDFDISIQFERDCKSGDW